MLFPFAAEETQPKPSQTILRETFQREKLDPLVWVIESESGWTDVQLGHGVCKLAIRESDEMNRAHSASLRTRQKFRFVEVTFHGLEVQGNVYFGLKASGWILVRNDLGYGWQLDVSSDWWGAEVGVAKFPRQQINLPNWTGIADVTVRWLPQRVEVWIGEKMVAHLNDPSGASIPQDSMALVFSTYGRVKGNFASLRGVTVTAIDGFQPIKREIPYLPTVWAAPTVPKKLKQLRSLRPAKLTGKYRGISASEKSQMNLLTWIADRSARDLWKTPEESDLQSALQAFKKQGAFFVRKDESGLWVSNQKVGIAFLPPEQGCGIASLYHLPTQTECIFTAPKPYVPFRLQIGDGKQIKEATNEGVKASAQVLIKGQQLQVLLRWVSEGWEVKGIVSLHANSSLLRWRASILMHQTGTVPYALFFPIFEHLGGEGENDVVISWGSGRGQLFRGLKGALWNSDSLYPSSDWTVQFLTMTFGEVALYLACHDGEMYTKSFHLHPGQKFYFTAFVPVDLNQPAKPKRFELPYDIVIGLIEGDWFDAAKLYRSWAIKQNWCAIGSLQQRKKNGNIALRMLESPIVVRPDWPRDYDEHTRRMKETEPWMGELEVKLNRELFGHDVPMVVWWYSWNKQRFDDDMPFFDPLPEIPKVFFKEVSEGLVVMPYTQSAWWDTELWQGEFGERARAAACKNPNGSLRTAEWVYCEPAEMCLSQKICQDVTCELAKKVADIGANAIYLDVFPVMRECWDKTHGHPLGVGGNWWAKSVRQILKRIKRERGWDFGVTMEYFAEPYLDLCDVQTSWWWVEAVDCPLLPAIYSGYAVWSGSHTHKHASDGLIAFRIKVGRCFLWGSQLGRSILSDYLGDERKAQFYRHLVRLKMKAVKFLVYGEMLRPPIWLSEVPKVVVEGWAMHPRHLPPFRYDAVEASLWKAPDGELGLFIVNYDDKPHTVEFKIGKWWEKGKRFVYLLTSEQRQRWLESVQLGERLIVKAPAANALALVFAEK